MRKTRPIKDPVLPEGTTLIARTRAGPKIGYWGRNWRYPSGIERYGQNRSQPAPPVQCGLATGSGGDRSASRRLHGKEGVRGSSPRVGFHPDELARPQWSPEHNRAVAQINVARSCTPAASSPE
jgi:hypothetical protein